MKESYEKPWREKTPQEKVERIADGVIECATVIAIIQPMIYLILNRITE